jgi:hypothetical protein
LAIADCDLRIADWIARLPIGLPGCRLDCPVADWIARLPIGLPGCRLDCPVADWIARLRKSAIPNSRNPKSALANRQSTIDAQLVAPIY